MEISPDDLMRRFLKQRADLTLNVQYGNLLANFYKSLVEYQIVLIKQIEDNIQKLEVDRIGDIAFDTDELSTLEAHVDNADNEVENFLLQHPKFNVRDMLPKPSRN